VACGRTHLPDRGWTELEGELMCPRALLTTRACWWAIGQLRREHASVPVWPGSWARPGGPCRPHPRHQGPGPGAAARSGPWPLGEGLRDWLKERGDAPPPGPAGTRGHRGRKGDALYGIRMLLRAGAENLTDRQRRRLAAAIGDNEAHLEVWLAWACAQRLRAAYRHPNPVEGRRSPSGSWRPSRPAP